MLANKKLGFVGGGNMAEALVNIAIMDPDHLDSSRRLIKEVVKRAIHPKVNPYKKPFDHVTSFGVQL